MNNNQRNSLKDQVSSVIAKRFVRGILLCIAALLVLIGILGYRYVRESLQPLDKTSSQVIEIHVKSGSTTKQIGDLLQKKKVIKSGFVFDYYVKSNKMTKFKSGYYLLKASMTLKQIAQKLEKGGSNTPLTYGKVLVQEGASIKQIAQTVAQNTKYTANQFLTAVNDKQLLAQLKQQYPALLGSAMSAKNTRYVLEGYLYPATYDANGVTLKQLITQMVAKANEVYTPYLSQIKKKGYTVQQALTLASLVEKEGVTTSDRKMIAGVFENRLKKNMKIQSDISVLYALSTTKTTLTYSDLKVKSPYNLYLHTGLGPGPFDNPSLISLQAVLNPSKQAAGYYYFVANTKTGKVYYAKTYAQHQANIKKIEQSNK